MTLEPPLADDAPGDPTSDTRRLGPFRLLRRIGAGGFGVVHEAWDTRLNRAIAIKILRESGTDARAKLLAEARASAGLEHRAFVRIIDVFEDESQVALVMELVRGHTLSALRQRGPMPVATALDLVQQVARAMSTAHTSGRIHGDLKPANLMVGTDGQVRILDFGLARDLPRTMAAKGDDADGGGTLAYMAPELLLGQAPHVGSDVYALGMILAELIGAARPFTGLEGGMLAHEIVHGRSSPADALTDLAAPVRELVADMVQRDPERRCFDMMVVVDRIERVRGDRRRASPPATAPSWLTSLTTTRLTQGLVVAGLLLVVSTLLLVQPWRKGDLADRLQYQDLNRADALLRQFDRPGHVAEAVALLEARLASNPEHAGAAADLAIAYCLRYSGDDRDELWLKRANTAADLALAADDQLARAHAAKAWSLEFGGRNAEALPYFERALLLDPSDRYALLGLSRTRARLGDDDAALQTLKTAMRLHPKDRVFVDALGTWHFRHARYADAETAFRQAITLEPASVVSRANLNAVLLRLDRPEEALSVLQEGLRLHPDGRLYSNLGTVLFSLGRYVEAADAFRHAVSPQRGSPNDYLRWANLADALRQIPGRDADAAAAYRTTLLLLAPIIERSPEDPALVSRLALYRAKLGDCVPAMNSIANVDRLHNESVDVLFRLAQAQELCGARDAAITDLARARALGHPLHLIQQEPDLIALRRDPRFLSDILVSTIVPPTSEGIHDD